jgi:cellobiose-specific phosphotransferase system component IIB
MLNIEMIKERIEQLANQSSSASSVTERVESFLNTGDSFVSSIAEEKKNVENVQIDDLLDEPHISVLIKQVEEKCASKVIELDAVPVEDDDSEILLKDSASDMIAGTDEKKSGILDFLEDADESLAPKQANTDPIWESNLDDSVFISDFMDSKDLADESIMLEGDLNVLHDESDEKFDEIGVGSLANFNKKNEKVWIDPSLTDSNAHTEDYDFTIFSVLAKKLLVQTNESVKEGKNPFADKNLTPDAGKNNENIEAVKSGANHLNVQGENQLSRKRRISADSSFEVLPKKSNVGDKAQLRVLDIFQKKFVAKRHSRLDSSNSVKDATVPILSEKAMDPKLETKSTQIAQTISAAPVPETHAETMSFSGSGYESEDISEISLKPIDISRKQGKPKKTKKSKVFDEPASSPSSANSSFSEKSSKGKHSA